MRYGVVRSVRAYRVEEEKYPEWRFQLPLTSVREIVQELSGLLNVSTPSVKFRSMSRTGGKYRSIQKRITISSYRPTIHFSTVVHEFAHHLNHVLNSRTGHDAYFLDALDKVYAVAKERYHGTLEKHKSEAYAHQAEQAQRVDEVRGKFRVGQRVSFSGRHGAVIVGTIYRINQRTLTVRNCNDGSHLGWRVGLHNTGITILENK